MRRFKVLFLFCLLVAMRLPEVMGHLCLISPRQRGEMDISKGGSPTCFRHGPECGGQAPELPPPNVLVAGQALFVKWQQNFNHYDIGYPGYMDIALAVANDLEDKSAPDPFNILATVADVDQYGQAHQQNYTTLVTLPDMECDHCVIRARYVSHKPGESIFYQCADVKLTKPTKSSSPQNLEEKVDLQQLLHMDHDRGSDLKPKLEIVPESSFMTESGRGHDFMNAESNSESLDLKGKEIIPQPSKDNMENRVELPPAIDNVGDAVLKPAHISSAHRQKSKLLEQNLEKTLGKISNEQPLQNALLFLRDHSSRNNKHQFLQGTRAPSYFNPVNSRSGTENPQVPKENPAGLERDSTMLPGYPDNSLKLYGMANSKDSTNSSSYLTIDAFTGEKRELNRLPFGVDSPVGQYVTDGVMTFDSARGLTLLTYNSHGNMDALPDRVVELNSNTGTVQTISNITARNGNVTLPTTAFSCVIVEIEDSYVTFNLEPDSTNSGFYFVVGRLYRDGSWEQLSKTNRLEDTYINFMWADFDISVKTLYVLLGNENDPYGLSARLYQFFVPPGNPLPEPIVFYSSVEVNMTQFPFMAFYLSSLRTDQLYAISPGTWNHAYPSYHLVVLNVDNGSVTDIGQLTPPGIFERFYGGSVFNGFNSLSNQLLHVLRVADSHSDVIMQVNVLTKEVRFSEMTNLRNVKNLACPWNVA